ncbi:Protein prenylyltransferase superfamily protein [Zea mays]|uniref:ER membrane protein complex subunit 2 n=1 Tax=Zea mays TaxID=4577 RepID=A0A1D6GDC0_MAIZE|nr:Protein prenylyltransferase superfamily protein [Zea mays]
MAAAAAVASATTAEDEARLLRLEEQAEHGGGGAWEYLCLARRLRARRPAHVLRVGLALLNNASARSGLASEQWTLYEQVATAAMDCQRLDVAKASGLLMVLQDCIGVLSKQFPGSTRVARLEARLFEAKGEWAEAERAYALILENNPFDQIVHKRKIAIAKAQGGMSIVIDYLNKYLELFMADHDAWRELAETYSSLQMYKQAAFCYEELILAQPTIPLYHIAYAEVLYTMGGLENLQTAKKYYASTIQLTGGKNTRALFGVCLCTSAINQLTKGRNKEEEDSELQSLAAEVLLKNYKQQAPSKAPLISSMLKNMKLS